MIEKQKISKLVSLFLENYHVYNVWLIWHLCLHTLVVLETAQNNRKIKGNGYYIIIENKWFSLNDKKWNKLVSSKK